MSGDIKNIETQFGGVTFRSRLEARWALWLNELRIEWLYEQEAFTLACGPYLPDFWLPSLSTFLEIKPCAPSLEERRKCQWLAAESGRRVVLMPYEPGGWLRAGAPESHVFIPFGGEADCDTGYTFCVCPVCRMIDLQWGGMGDRICGNGCAANEGRTDDDPAIVEAARRANGHRFWNPGEVPT